MNKRLAKKRRMKYIAQNDYPKMPFHDDQCPYCGFDADGIDGNDIAVMGGSISYKDEHPFFDGTYSGITWTEVVKCPICGRIYEYENSNI